MKKFLFMAIAAIVMTGCVTKDSDTPSVSFYQESYTASSKGGELIIPVKSTGVDDVVVSYKHSSDAWSVDPETGDMTPDGWIEIKKIIEHHDTRLLLKEDSGIVLQIKPNNGKVERVGYVTVRSYQAEETVTIKQGF